MNSKYAKPITLRLKPLSRLMACGLALWAVEGVRADNTVGAATQTGREEPPAQVIITGNPLGSHQMAQAAEVLQGDALSVRLAPTLGQTLDGLPGVASSWFGPNSNRPVIRGLDGDRVRLLDNGGSSIDASSLSYDHAVALDPLVVERVEVLRGPASLLYGGSATGGVVNTIDNRVPKTTIEGLGGRAEARVGGAAQERSGSVVLEGGTQGFNWHVDGFKRRTDDLSVPRFRPVEEGEEGEATRHVRNSASDSWGGALGASWTDAQGYVGASLDTYRNEYGVTVEPDVNIHMRRDRLTFAGARRLDLGPNWLESVDWQYGHSRYKHQEIEGTGEVGTTFRSTGDDGRLEIHHRGWLGTRGVIGLQTESMSFSALGEEAFVPSTLTRQLALFALEDLGHWGADWQAGLRAEQVRVHSDGDEPAATEAKFGDETTHRFHPWSASLSGVWSLAPQWSLSTVMGSTQRAPAYYELFANGVHVATAAYERGSQDLGIERSVHADLGVEWKDGANRAKVQVYAMHFGNYIGLESTGIEVDDGEGGTVPEYLFSGMRARLWGAELEAVHRASWAGWQWDLQANLDWTRGDNLDTHDALPRLAPWRLGLSAQGHWGPWQVGLQWRHVAEQDRVPSTDTRTPGYSTLGASVAWSQQWGRADALWFLRGDNLTNQLAYNASSIETMRRLAPLPGRAVTAGVRVRF